MVMLKIDFYSTLEKQCQKCHTLEWNRDGVLFLILIREM